MVSISIRTSLSLIRATTAILDTGRGYNFIRRSALRLVWQRPFCLDYKIPLLGDANGNVLHILSATILSIRFGSTAYKTIFLGANYFSVELLFETRIMNCYLKSFAILIDK